MTDTSQREFKRSSSYFGLNWQDHFKPFLKYASLAMLLVVMLGPVYFSFVLSLKSPEAIFTEGIGIPFVTFQPISCSEGLSWCNMWHAFPFIEYTLATFVVSIGTAMLATVAAVFAAYSFARLDFPFKSAFFVVTVSGFMFPIVLIAIPLFVLMSQVNLINTYVGMILAFTSFALPYNVWLLRGFFEDLPENLEESAQVDGCTKIGAFFRVILPLSRPAIASVFLFAFLLAWHNYVIAYILANDAIHTTLAPGVLQLRGTFYVENFHFIMAGIFLTIVVPVVMYAYLQKYLVEGLTAGAGVKG